MEGFTLPFIEKIPLLGFNIFTFYRVAFVVLFPTKLDSLDSDFIYKSYGSSGFTIWNWSGDGPESPVPPESPAQRTRTLRSCVFWRPVFILWCGTVLGSGGTRRWYGVSGPKDPESPASSFFSALCIFVVRYWIGARSIPGESPESPAL